MSSERGCMMPAINCDRRSRTGVSSIRPAGQIRPCQRLQCGPRRNMYILKLSDIFLACTSGIYKAASSVFCYWKLARSCLYFTVRITYPAVSGPVNLPGPCDVTLCRIWPLCQNEFQISTLEHYL